MNSRILRLFRDSSYRAHVREEAALFARYPRAIGYKGGALISNRGRRLARKIRNGRKVSCAICGWSGNRFDTIATFGYSRRNASCPGCGALERHRAMIDFLSRQGWLHRGDTCLDVGGIPAFRPWFQSQGVHYVSMSLADKAMVAMDIERLGFAGDSFDLILDAHVLEYVSDYKRALLEMARVMRTGGKMLLTEAYDFGQPLTKEFGRPNPAATFMVRRFGDDLLAFIEAAGFAASRWDYTGRNDRNGDYFFICEKKSNAQSRAARVA